MGFPTLSEVVFSPPVYDFSPIIAGMPELMWDFLPYSLIFSFWITTIFYSQNEHFLCFLIFSKEVDDFVWKIKFLMFFYVYKVSETLTESIFNVYYKYQKIDFWTPPEGPPWGTPWGSPLGDALLGARIGQKYYFLSYLGVLFLRPFWSSFLILKHAQFGSLNKKAKTYVFF